MSKPALTEAELHAYVDGALPDARRAEVEAYLAAAPDEAARVHAYEVQNTTLRRLFDPLLDDAVPERLRLPLHARRRFSLAPYAAAAAWLALGTLIGWQLGSSEQMAAASKLDLARRAAIAHAVYVPEVRHPVEVGADQEAHLLNWLSKRLATPLQVPQLREFGYALVGGRLLPGDSGPVAQFMYQDDKGQRLTLYIRRNGDDAQETAFRFSNEGKIGVFYWLDGQRGYALSGEIDKAALLAVANAVYRQLNP